MDPDEIYAVEADIFAPCAMGAVLNDTSVADLRSETVGGAANNQLAREEHGEQLRARGILYALDFVINAGGMIRVASERECYDEEVVKRGVEGIAHTLHAIFERAEADGVFTQKAALRLAHARLVRAGSEKQSLVA